MGIIVGIVGSEAAKFTANTEASAKVLIYSLLSDPNVEAVCSGRCHLGGIDIWAEEIGEQLGKKLLLFPPLNLQWSTGYKPRNLKIAFNSDEVHCITVKELPKNYKGMRFDLCYHCNSREHVKSGGCWTVKEAIKLGKPGYVHVV